MISKTNISKCIFNIHTPRWLLCVHNESICQFVMLPVEVRALSRPHNLLAHVQEPCARAPCPCWGSHAPPGVGDTPLHRVGGGTLSHSHLQAIIMVSTFQQCKSEIVIQFFTTIMFARANKAHMSNIFLMNEHRTKKSEDKQSKNSSSNFTI